MTRKEWRRAGLPAIALTLVAVLAGACTKDSDNGGAVGGRGGSAAGTGGAKPGSGGGGGGGNANGGSSGEEDADGTLPDLSNTGSVDTATTPPMTCAAIRNCVTACKGDNACKQRCPSMAPQTERMAFTAIETCSKKECPTGDEPCRCEVECLAGGVCTDMVDVCRGFEDDVFCDVDCH